MDGVTNTQHTPAVTQANASLTIAGYVAFSFIGYFTIGLALAVLPVFIHEKLGYSTFVAGLVISLQYATTFIFRGYGGNIVDKKGPKPAVVKGMLAFGLSGILLLMAFLCKGYPAISLGLLVITRLATGMGEGLIGASPITWAILATEDKYTGRAISYNGIANYGAIAAGAPLGVILQNTLGVESLGVFTIIIAAGGYFYARNKKALKGDSRAPRESFLKVLKKVTPYGICLALGGLGFGAISTFITLYYAFLKWQGAVQCLCAFSIMFITGRLVFEQYINKYSGLKTAIVCLAIETVGHLVLWQAVSPYMALLGAAIAGLGFSLVFPALGVEAIKQVPPSNKGAAIGGYGLFIDLSLGITGPLVGAVAGAFGLGAIYLFSMAMVFAGFLLTIMLTRRKLGYEAAID